MNKHPRWPADPRHDFILREFGERLRRARRHADLTGAEVGDRAGMHPSQVYQVESGQANVTLRTLLRMADAVGAEPCSLLPGVVCGLLPSGALEEMRHLATRQLEAVSSGRPSQADLRQTVRLMQCLLDQLPCQEGPSDFVPGSEPSRDALRT